MSEMISVADAEKEGACASPMAIGIGLGAKMVKLYDLKGSNVRSFNQRDKVIICEGVVVPTVLNLGDSLILSEFTAPLVGYFNPEPGVMCAAYGKPQLRKARSVSVICTQGAVVASHAFYYDCVVFHLVADVAIDKPGAE